MTDAPQWGPGDRGSEEPGAEATGRAWSAVGGADANPPVPIDPVTGRPTGPSPLPPVNDPVNAPVTGPTVDDPTAPAVPAPGTAPGTLPAPGSGAFTLPPAGPDTLAPTPESAGDPMAPPPEPPPALAATDLALVTGDGVIFRAIDLTVQPGTVAAIVGPSGTGRSCLLLALTGRMAHSAGTLKVAGQDATGGLDKLRSLTGVARISHRIGPEPTLTVAESVDERCLIEDVPLDEGRHRFAEVCRTLELDVKPSTLVRDIGGVDGTKLAVALAAVRVSAVLVLDDLDGGISGQEEFDLLHALIDLAATGPAIIVTTTDPYPVADAQIVITMPDRDEPVPVVADAVVVVPADPTADPAAVPGDAAADAPTQMVTLAKPDPAEPAPSVAVLTAPGTPEAAGPPVPPPGAPLVAPADRPRRWPFGRRRGRHAAPETTDVTAGSVPGDPPPQSDPAAATGAGSGHPDDPPTDVFPAAPGIYGSGGADAGPGSAGERAADEAATAWWTEPSGPTVGRPSADDPAGRPPTDPPAPPAGAGPRQEDPR